MNDALATKLRNRRPGLVGLGTIVALLLFAGTALASSYWSTLDYKTQAIGAVRSYSGSNVAISLTSVQSGPGVSTTHRVTLVRRTCAIVCWEDQIGSVNVPRNGASGQRTWTNVGSGNYYFYFTKAADGVRITSNNVHMWNP